MQDEEIICIALLKVKLLDALNPADIRVLSQFFNITEKGMFQQTMMELKKSIAYIILIERYDLEEYLCLSKFKRLPTHLHQLLLLYFRSVRECFQNEKRSIQQQNLRNLQKTATGMEKLSSLMQNAINKNSPPSEKTDHGFNRYNFFNQYSQNMPENRLSYSMPSMPSYVFPYQNYVNNNMFPDYSNRSNIVSNIMLDKSKEQERASQFSKKVQLPQKIENSQNFKQEYFSDSNIQSQEGQAATCKYQCFCGQKKEDDLVECKKCKKQYHFKCWTPISPDDSVCPFCKLNYKHCYTKLAGDTILERCEQASSKLSNVKKILLSSEQLQKLNNAIKLAQNSQLYWLQLRMLRVQMSNQSQSKGVKSSFTIAVSEAKKLYNRKWLEIKLTNIGEGGLFLVTLVCTTPKEFQEVRNQVFSQKEQNQNFNPFKKNFALAEVQSGKLNYTHPITNKPVSTPVRGVRCQHFQCEDLRYVYEMGSKRQPKIVCSFCNKHYSVYEAFQFDRVTFERLKELAQKKQSQAIIGNSIENRPQNSLENQKPQIMVQNKMIDEKQEEDSRNIRESSFQRANSKQKNDQYQKRLQ